MDFLASMSCMSFLKFMKLMVCMVCKKFGLDREKRSKHTYPMLWPPLTLSPFHTHTLLGEYWGSAWPMLAMGARRLESIHPTGKQEPKPFRQLPIAKSTASVEFLSQMV